MAEFLASKLVIVEEEPRIATFPTLQTAVPGFMGVAERGPIRAPTFLTSFEEYYNIYGGFVNTYELAQCVRAFFLNGGKACYVSRVVHYSSLLVPTVDSAAKATAALIGTVAVAAAGEVEGTATATFDLEPNDTIIASVDGDPDDTATFTATAATHECVTAETYALTDAWDLTVKIDGGSVQTVVFNTADFSSIGAATAEEVAAVINQDLVGARAYVSTGGTKVTIDSDKRGTDSHVEVTGGTANGAFGFTTSEIDGTGNVADIDAVTYAEAKAVLEAALTGGGGVLVSDGGSGKVTITTIATGATKSIEVKSSSTADSVFGLDNTNHAGSDSSAGTVLTINGKTEGAYGNSISIGIENATNHATDPTEFNLTVTKNGVLLETFPNLSMTTTEDRFVETIINADDDGSVLITAVAATTTRPDNVSASTLASGDDGLTSLEENDFIGSSVGSTGVYAFDLSTEMTILASPDRTHIDVHNQMLTYCKTDRQGLVFAVLDPPAGYSTSDIVTHRASVDTEEVGALYWPRIKIVNPAKAIFGDTRALTVAPSGTICGIMARNDGKLSAGVFAQPAGVDNGKPVGVTGVETDEVKLEAKRDLVFPKRINPITAMPGHGVFIDGARTLKSDGNFPSIGERRGVSHIESLLDSGLQFARHKNNNAELRRKVERSIFALLLGFTVQGAFASRNPEQAFFVDVSDELNPPSVQRAGKLILRVGIATAKPAEYIVVKVTQDTRALEEELLSAGL